MLHGIPVMTGLTGKEERERHFMPEPYLIYGVDNSFYTLKTVGAFRASGVPFTYQYKSLAVRAEVEQASGYKLMPVVQTPAGTWQTDSTPILLALDASLGGNQLLPDDPVLVILGRMLDDWIDEWLVRPAVFWRSNNPDDRDFVARVAACNLMGLSPQQSLIDEQEKKMLGLAGRLTDFFARIGTINRAMPEHEAEIMQLLDETCRLLSDHFRFFPFLLGTRPSLPDFAFYGCLHAHLLFEPGPTAYLSQVWPEIVAYHDRIHVAVLGQGEWMNVQHLPDTLKSLLQFIASDFHGFLAANKLAVERGQEMATWADKQMTARKYTERCRLDIVTLFTDLPPADRDRANAFFAATNILTLYQN
jgi:glutathione S-transferase